VTGEGNLSPSHCYQFDASPRSTCQTLEKDHRMFLDFIDDNLLLQVTEETMRKGAMLDLVLTNTEELVGNAQGQPWLQ